LSYLLTKAMTTVATD